MKIKKFNKFNENNTDHKSEHDNYMFFSNLDHIDRMSSEMIKMDKKIIDGMLTDGHDWANDHVSKAMESLEHVYNFLHSALREDEKI